MNNMHLNFGLHFEKKKLPAEKRESGHTKVAKIHVFDRKSCSATYNSKAKELNYT